MNSGTQTNTANGHAPAGGMNLDDVLYTLFRHKWLIAAFVCLGILAVCAIRVIKKPPYGSHAQLMIHYIEERSPTPSSQDSQIHNPEAGGLALLNTEKELLKSLDVATNVARMIGARRLLGGKGDDLIAAAGVVGAGLEVEVPAATPILTITFKHRNRYLVQDVVGAVVEAYKQKHQEVHGGGGSLDEFYRQQKNALRAKLTETEEALKKIKTNANLLSVEQKKQAYQAEISKWEQELHSKQVELDAKKSVLGDAINSLGPESTNLGAQLAPSEKIREYGEVAKQIEHLKRVKQDLLVQYKEAYPMVVVTTGQIERLTAQKADMEKAYPTLAHIDLNASSGGTNSAANELAEIRTLSATLVSITALLSNLTANASHVMELEPVIADLQRQRDLEETNFYRYSEALDRQKIAQELSGGKPVNIGTIEQPTPPALDSKKLMKILGGAFGGCVAMGLGLAFLMDFVMDRSLRRPSEVRRHLKQAVFLTIPDTSWQGPAKLPPILGRFANGLKGANGARENGRENGSQAVTAWKPEETLSTLATHTAGLRERIVTHFELSGMGPKKPKLVGLTGCHQGAGVSALATGLAISLSEVGEQNVLLVDLNHGDGIGKAYRHGKPASDVSNEIGAQPAVMGMVSDLADFAATESESGSMAVGFPSRFVQLVPEFKASDYDYIVFDMPPVGPTTPTPRLSNHMDVVLMVIESEKTSQQLALRGQTLLQESQAKVLTVLNKYRSYVPVQFSHEI